MVVIIDTQGVVRWNGNPNLPVSYGNCYWVLQADGNYEVLSWQKKISADYGILRINVFFCNLKQIQHF